MRILISLYNYILLFVNSYSVTTYNEIPARATLDVNCCSITTYIRSRPPTPPTVSCYAIRLYICNREMQFYKLLSDKNLEMQLKYNFTYKYILICLINKKALYFRRRPIAIPIANAININIYQPST